MPPTTPQAGQMPSVPPTPVNPIPAANTQPVQALPQQPLVPQRSSNFGKWIVVLIVVVAVVVLSLILYLNMRKPDTYSISTSETVTPTAAQTRAVDRVDTSLNELDSAVGTLEADINNATDGLNDQPDNL